jgi:hypothetical protein
MGTGVNCFDLHLHGEKAYGRFGFTGFGLWVTTMIGIRSL